MILFHILDPLTNLAGGVLVFHSEELNAARTDYGSLVGKVACNKIHQAEKQPVSYRTSMAKRLLPLLPSSSKAGVLSTV